MIDGLTGNSVSASAIPRGHRERERFESRPMIVTDMLYLNRLALYNKHLASPLT
jgi:hypothetical protein